MSKFRTRVAVLVGLTTISFACSRPVADRKENAEVDASTTLESALPQMMEAAAIPGLSVCVIDDFDVAWCGAFGSADEDVAVSRDTVFQAASLSKPVFAYAVLKLVDEGVLDLDTPLVESVDEETLRADHLGRGFDDPRLREITVRTVLEHSTGFPNWRGNGELEIRFDPGDRFGYSGEAFGLLQKVVERVTGRSLEAVVQHQVFEPLAMMNSTYTVSRVDLGSYAWPHQASGEPRPKPADLEQRLRRAQAHAAASLLTTAPDYARFLVALMDGEGLRRSTHRELFRPQIEVREGGGDIAWGLGTGLELADDRVRAWHWGDNGDSKAFYLVDLEEGSGVVYFANSYNGLAIMRPMAEVAVPGDHPIFDSGILDGYPPHDSVGFRLMQAVYRDGASGARQVLRDAPASGEKPSEAVVNELGYWLLRRDRLDEAIELFELNVTLYPEAWNVYDSLGEAQLEKGLRDEGLASYRRSLELNPDNDNARRVLAEAAE